MHFHDSTYRGDFFCICEHPRERFVSENAVNPLALEDNPYLCAMSTIPGKEIRLPRKRTSQAKRPCCKLFPRLMALGY